MISFNSRRVLHHLMCAMTGIFISTSICSAESGKEPFTLMDTGELKAALDNPDGKVVLIDARPSDRYLAGHIKGALNIPAPVLEKQLALLKVPKNAKVLIYCDGVRCNRKTGQTPDGMPCWSLAAILPTKSGKAAKTVVDMGYRDVAVLMVGFRGWDQQGNEAFVGRDDQQRLETVKLGMRELKELANGNAGQVLFIDARIPADFKASHVSGAINMPVESPLIATAFAALNRNKKIVVYCDWGERSQRAYHLLQQQGFTNIARALTADLEEAGLPLEKE